MSEPNQLDMIVDETIKLMPEPTTTIGRIGFDNGESNAVSGVGVGVGDTASDSGSDSDNFDPEIHATDEHGNPVLNKDGSYRKKRGRKKGGTNVPQGPSAEEIARKQAVKQAAISSANGIFALGMALGGEEWQPIVSKQHDINEPEQMTAAFEAYYDATGMRDIPPWAVLGVALASYTLPRLRMPKTKSRLGLLWQWTKFKLSNMRKK